MSSCQSPFTPYNSIHSMERSLQSNKIIPNYILISLAIVQSEIYWLYSVIHYLCRESGILNKPPSSVSTFKRIRSYSAPPEIKPFSDNLNDKNDEKNQGRRFSLPDGIVNIRERPTKKDEQAGTTCPPLRWQKTRVKLGHAPVHRDFKSKKSILGNNNTPPTTVTFANVLTNSSIKRADNISPPVTVHTITNSPLSSPTLTPSDRKIDAASLLCLTNFSTNTSLSTEGSFIRSTGSSGQPRKSKRKNLLTKINAALHHRRKNDTNVPPRN